MNPLRTRSRLARRTTAASAALLLSLALTACGGDDESGDDAPDERASASSEAPAPDDDETTADETAAAVPTEEELEAVLLTSADLPAGFEVDPDDGDEEDEVAFEDTCLESVGEFSEALGSEPDEEAEVDLVAEGTTGQTGVMSQVEAYADAGPVPAAFSDFTEQLQSCTTVQTTNDDGLVIDLEIAYDDTVDLPGADDQLAIDMTGTISSGAEEFPVAYQYTVALAGSYISIVGTFALGEDTSGVLEQSGDLAALQLERVGQLG